MAASDNLSGQFSLFDEMDMADLNKPDTRIPDYFRELGLKRIAGIKAEHGWK